MVGFIIAIVFVLAAMLFAMFRGASRSIFRIAGIIVSAVGALIVTIGVKSMATSQETVLPILENAGVNVGELLAQINEYSPNLVNLLAGSTVSFLAPFIFLVSFIALAIVTWVLYFILSLILFPIFHKLEKKNHHRKPISLAVGAVQAALVLFLVISPVSYYVGAVENAMPAIEESGIITEIATSFDVSEDEIKAELSADSKFDIVKLNSKLGGNAFSKALATYSYNDAETGERVKVDLADELVPMLDITMNVVKLTGAPMAEYGEAEAKAIENIGETFSESAFVSTVSKELVHGMTQAWNEGKPYAGIEKPAIGEPADDIFNNLVKIFNKSSEKSEYIGTDIKDVSKIVSTLVKADVMKDMNTPDVLLEKLSANGTVNDVTAILRTNERLRPLISDITTLSVYVLADTLGVPKDKETVYLNMLNDVSAKLNEVKVLDVAERLETLEPFVKNELAMIGANVSDEYVGSVCQALVADFGDVETVTPDYISEFFLIYEQSRGELVETVEVFAGSFYGFVRIKSNDADFTFEKYKTQEARDNSGASIIGKLDAEIIKITANETSVDVKREQISVAVTEMMTPIFSGIIEKSENKEKAETIIKNYSDTVQNLSEKDTKENIQSSNNLASFAKSESANINCMTLTDIKDKFQTTAELTDETEAEKHSEVINKVIDCASALLAATKKDETVPPVTDGGNAGEGNKPEGGDGNEGGDTTTPAPDTGKDNTLDILKATTEGIGSIFDTLSKTEVFGKDDTANLMQSILTSEKVSNVIPLTKEEADKIVDKVKNDEETSYGDLMLGVSGMAELIFSMTEGNCTEDSVKNLINGLNEKNIDAIMVLITEDRFTSIGIKGDKVAPTHKIMTALLHELAKVTEDRVDSEAKAVKKLIDVALAAKASGTGLFGEEGRIGDAHLFIEEILASEAVCNTIEGTEADPFGVSEKVSDADKELFKAACETYIGTEDEETVVTLASIFGITID